MKYRKKPVVKELANMLIGLIVVGYQGIGKSTVAMAHTNHIDLESSNFFIDGKRDENWYKPYCNIAMHLRDQCNVVFLSSHAVVRDRLAENITGKQVIIYPALSLKKEWIKRLEDRFIEFPTDKNFKALSNAKDRYDENILELKHQPGFDKIEVNNVDYNLYKLLQRYRTQSHLY